MKSVWQKVTIVGIGAAFFASTFLSSGPVSAAHRPDSLKKSLQQKTASLKTQAAESKSPLFSDDTLIVKYKQAMLPSEIKGSGRDFVIIQNSEKMGYMAVKLLDKSKLKKVTEAFQKNSKVLSVERSVLYKTYSLPSDPKAKEEYYLSMLKIPEAQKLAGNSKVTVAVIDTGIDQNHPELKGKVLPAYNEINPMEHGAPDEHGTHVTGIIAAAKGNEIGGYGINPNVRILPINVFDRDGYITDYTIAQAVLYAADHGARIINMSLGSPEPSSILEEAVKSAIRKGVTIIAASGNDGISAPNYPASYEGVIGVGSVNKSKQLSYFSSYGPSMDLVAPGEDIYAPFYDYEKKSTFQTESGTSMAAPMVSGIASLLLAKHPGLKPVQLEYILEHTADDLGAKGYDLRYGNGLVDPVNALKFNLKKLPSFVNQVWNKKAILQKAEELTLRNTLQKTASITKPMEQKWFQFPVKKGEYIQAALSGAAEFNYKMSLRFYADDESQSIEVNKADAGKTEGKLVKAPFTGTMAIGINDINGNYDDSRAKHSTFQLFIRRSAAEPKDESTEANPVEIKNLPFQSVSSYFTGDNGDDDFYHFKTGTQNVVRISLSGVPGVDSNIEVYNLDALSNNSENGAERTANQAAELPSQLEQVPADAQSDRMGAGGGETLTFTVEPKTNYAVRISSKPLTSIDGSGGAMLLDQTTADTQSSLLPYTIKVEGKVLPKDEDGLPAEGGDDGSYSNYVKTTVSHALPAAIEKTMTGYLQTTQDEDWFKVKPSVNGIYEFSLPKSYQDKPLVEVMEVVTAKDENGKAIADLNLIGDNQSSDWLSGEKTDHFFTGLKKNKMYLVHVAADQENGAGLSINPYQVSSKLIAANPQDKYEDNDAFDHIKDLPAASLTGNFTMPNDVDNFYLQGRRTCIYSILFENKKLSQDIFHKYSKDLFEPVLGLEVVYQDVNKNRKIDAADTELASIMAKGLFEGTTTNYGSFKVEKGKNYIISVTGIPTGTAPISLVPYHLAVSPLSTKDEDAKSVIKHNVPSRPLTLKPAGSHTLAAKGQLNSGIGYGDQDWYVLNVKGKMDGYITFEGGTEVDGVISLYHNGKKIKNADYYGSGQSEIMPIHLSKGKYYFSVKDVYGNSTIKPYKVKVTYK